MFRFAKQLIVMAVLAIALSFTSTADAAISPVGISNASYAQATAFAVPYSGVNQFRFYAVCADGRTYTLAYNVNAQAGYEQTFQSPCGAKGTKNWQINYNRIGNSARWYTFWISVCAPPNQVGACNVV